MDQCFYFYSFIYLLFLGGWVGGGGGGGGWGGENMANLWMISQAKLEFAKMLD